MSNYDDLARALGLNKKQLSDSIHYGYVYAVNADGTYQCFIDGSTTPTKCSAMCNVTAGTRVLVAILKNGSCVVFASNSSGGGGSASYAVGMMMEYAGSVAPDGWLICDGSEVDRSTYAELFNVIGTIYGSGDGSTTFNIPDMRGRFALGLSSDYALGTTGGSPDAVSVSHYHDRICYNGNSGWTVGDNSLLGGTQTDDHSMYYTGGTGKASTAMSHWRTSTNGEDGAGKNMPPFTATNYIIYCGAL